MPGGNTLEEIFQQSFAAMEELAAKHDGQTIALFAHRVINKLLVLGALGLKLDRFSFIRQDNCCMNKFERIQNSYVIVSLNDTSHLQREGVELLTAEKLLSICPLFLYLIFWMFDVYFDMNAVLA